MMLTTEDEAPIKQSPNKTSTMCKSFRELTRNYFAHERKWEFLVEALLFAVILAISAVPVLAAANALAKYLPYLAS